MRKTVCDCSLRWQLTAVPSVELTDGRLSVPLTRKCRRRLSYGWAQRAWHPSDLTEALRSPTGRLSSTSSTGPMSRCFCSLSCEPHHAPRPTPAAKRKKKEKKVGGGGGRYCQRQALCHPHPVGLAVTSARGSARFAGVGTIRNSPGVLQPERECSRPKPPTATL